MLPIGGDWETMVEISIFAKKIFHIYFNYFLSNKYSSNMFLVILDLLIKAHDRRRRPELDGF